MSDPANVAKINVLELSKEHRVPTLSFVIVRLTASSNARTVAANCYLNNQLVASGSATDSEGSDKVHSAATQTITLPVPPNAIARVERASGNGKIDIYTVIA